MPTLQNLSQQKSFSVGKVFVQRYFLQKVCLEVLHLIPVPPIKFFICYSHSPDCMGDGQKI